MKTFLAEEVEYCDLLLKLEDLNEVPGEEKVKNFLKEVHEKHKIEDKDKNWLNHQLYQISCLNLEGNALKIVKNLNKESEINGIVGWCKLMLDCSSMTSQRMQGLASKVYSPKRIKNYSDVNAAIEEWESNMTLFATVENMNRTQLQKYMQSDKSFLKN